MKKILSILILMLLAFPAMLRAQSDSAAVENSGYDTLQRGTVRVFIENQPCGGAYSRFGLWDDVDEQVFFLTNLGVGAEYLYKTNRSVGVSMHANYLDPFGSFDPVPIYDFKMYNITTGVMHRWYKRRWVFGAGLSFEKRSLKYNVYERNHDIDPEPQIYDYGETNFVNSHYNLGIDAMVGWSWGRHKWYIGLKLSSRIIMKDSFCYSKPPVTPVKFKKSTGSIDAQMAFILRFAFSVAKIK